MTKYYGVSQSSHGYEFRWIFEKEVIEKSVGTFPENELIDIGFPMGSRNSSATLFEPLENDEEAKEFLTRIADGPDLDDPTLIDIAEYELSINTEFGSCTGEFLKKFGLNPDELTQYDDVYDHLKNAKNMIREIVAYGGCEEIDMDNPFYGYSRELRYSELCDIYDRCVKGKEKTDNIERN